MDVAPPTLQDVEASAAASGLLTTLSSVRAWLGPEGRRYGPRRSLTFEDSHAAASMFGLELFPSPAEPEGVPLCADIEPRVSMALAVAFECGAILEHDDRLVPTPGWDDDDPIVRASVALSSLLDLGPMQTSLDHVDAFIDVRDAVLDAIIVNWLATLLPPGRTHTFDHFVDWAIGEWRQQFGRDVSGKPGDVELWAANGTSYLIDTLAWAGAIEWRDRELLVFELDEPLRFHGGGEIALTALGQHVLPDHLADAGLKLRAPEPTDRSRRSARGLLGDVTVCTQLDERAALVDGWRRDIADAERARLVVDVLNDTHALHYRMAAFDVLERIGPDVAAPYVRQLLDSPAAEAAAEFLVTHGLADAEQLSPFVGYGPLLEVFATAASRPEIFRRQFVRMLEQCEAPELLLEVFALYETDAATIVLTAAARHVDDARFAATIQAAETYHHAVMLDRDPAA